MAPDDLHDRILGDESLTNDLDEREAGRAVAWLLNKADSFAGTAGAGALVDALRVRVRAAGKTHAAIRSGDPAAAAKWAARAGIAVPPDGPDLFERLLAQLELPPATESR